MSRLPKTDITIYRGWDTPGKYVWSPFVNKLEFRLRTSGIKYACAAGSIHAAPKGKIPYLELSSQGHDVRTLADSGLIIKELIAAGFMEDINSTLTKKEQAQDLAFRAVLEDKLYFYTGHERWVKNYYTMRDHTLWAIPYPLRIIIGLLAYRGNVRKLHDQGAGRFSEAELGRFIHEIWQSINGMLEESKKNIKDPECFWLLGGQQATEADATVFGFVVSVLVCDAGPESGKLLRESFPVVVEYARRIHDTWFPDYEFWKE
ncbi:hypothetical protein BS50DRAFT_572639 [Corynespora cassiicola Philippines]|uniref:Thioredoxin-like fold domain-containing protein n=1 Tax=Corynespora cassiicola Philippines TaxID=1448308 RepID=A0A2T2NVY1_CORCC|nr:hypothetical protein BS50DRAFT_572639 [Corynespora cassiicola Philippines]